MSELVTIKKVGHPTLKIVRAALAQHVHLGWTQVENTPEPKVEAAKEEAPPKLSLKK